MKVYPFSFFIIAVATILASCGGGSSQQNSVTDPVVTQVSAPVFSPESATYSRDIDITITSETAGASIYYTLDGSVPDEGSLLYRDTIFVGGNGNTSSIRAIAIKQGLSRSAISNSDYRIQYPKIVSLTANYPSGEYVESFNVQLSSETQGIRIFYTLDGTLPDEDSLAYPEAGITIDNTRLSIHVQAIALGENLEASDIFSATYTFPSVAPYLERSGIAVELPNHSTEYNGSFTLVNPQDTPVEWRVSAVKVLKSKEYRDQSPVDPDSVEVSLRSQSVVGKQIYSREGLSQQKSKRSYSRKDVVPGKVMVKIAADLSLAKNIHRQRHNIVNMLDSDITDSWREMGVVAVDLLAKKPSISVDDDNTLVLLLTLADSYRSSLDGILGKLNSDPRVLYAEPDYQMHSTALIPNDDLFNRLYGLQTPPDGELGPGIHATAAWERAGGHKGNKSVLIGVFDSGVDYTHPDLAANMWVNPNEISNNGIDDDNNGYIDDVHGYDFLADNGDPIPTGSAHGTHVAGIIGAVGDNETGVSGVMWDANIVALKMLGSQVSISDAVRAVEYAKALGVKIFNFSWRTSGNSLVLEEALQDAGLVVVAAGNEANGNLHVGFDNDKNPVYPASYDLPNIIAVAASDEEGQLADFSNYGKISVDLAAPGANILSTWLDNRYRENSGTSMAAPHVAGVAGLMLSYRNDLDALALKRHILATVDKVDHLNDRVASSGLLNADRAMAAIELDWFAVDISQGEATTGASEIIPFTMDTAAAVAGDYIFEVGMAVGQGESDIVHGTVSVTVPPCFSAALNQENLDFGIARIGEHIEKTLSISNTCNAPITISGIQSDNDVGNFYLANGPVVIYPFSSQSIVIGYESDDTKLGEHTGVLSLQATQELVLSSPFSVNNILGPRLEMMSEMVIAQDRHQQQRHSHTVTNSGDEPLTINYRGGPTFFDRNTSSSPSFVWNDISETGTSLAELTSSSENGRIELPFAFPFYDNEYTDIYVNPLGVVTFGEPYADTNNKEIPESDAPPFIAPYWNNIALDAYERLFFQSFGDYAIIQFYNAESYFFSIEATYQIVLHASGDFYFYYNQLTGYISNASIGYQDGEGNGRSLSFRDTYPQSEQAVWVAQSPWLEMNDIRVTLAPGESYTHEFTVATESLVAESYNGGFSLDHNGTNNRDNRVRITLNLSENP